MHHIRLLVSCWSVILAGMVLAAPAPSHAQAPLAPLDRLANAVEDVSGAEGVRFGARDTQGTPLEGLKAIRSGSTTVGVYHAQAGRSFETYVGTSSDLLTWSKRARLDTDASQPTIVELSDGGFLVAYEWANLVDLLPRWGLGPFSLPAPLNQLTPLQQLVVTLDRIRIRFRYYPNLTALLAGRHSREFTAPRQLSLSAQGTPAFTSVQLDRGLSRSQIELSLHYRADTDANGFPDVDRQATAVLRNFSSWTSSADTQADARLAAPPQLHPPYTTGPSGNYGDRDDIVLDGTPLRLVEAQYRREDFGSWRLFAQERSGPGPLRALQPRTPNGSTAFGNPAVSEVRTSDGRRALLISAFVFGEGAGDSEPGALVYYHPLG